jgi:mono/diheme cytochrome c family protein
VESSDVLLVAVIVLVPAALMWGIFIVRSGRPGKPPRARLGIPMALRPAESDEKLEGPRLERIQVWGVISAVALAAFIPIYWLPERDRQEHFEERFSEESIHRGGLIYQTPPVLEEGIEAVAFKELEEEIALGQNCAFCHGGNAQGGPVPNGFVDPATGETVQYNAPPLNNVFQRWDEEVIRFTIERGRPGTPMPAWGVAYGGPMTEQMVTDVIAYLKNEFPANSEPPEELAAACANPNSSESLDCSSGKEIFEARCAVCHGPEGQGKEESGGLGWFQGMALWDGDVTHLPESLHYQTIVNGRRFAFMPAFGEAPSQGIPVPLYPLTDDQIRAVMAYERSLGGGAPEEPLPSPSPEETTEAE